MKITVVSDTHGNFDVLYGIVSRSKDSDTFIHLGDGEREFEDVRSVFPDKAFVYVKGNNDWGNYLAVSCPDFAGHRFYLCHGHRFPHGELKTYLAASASLNGCRVALFGHTHVPCDEEVNGVHLFNPGSASLPRGGRKPSYGIIDINGENIGFKIIEL